jgi:hypothetical protein
MNFALLGNDPAVLPLVHAMGRQERHSIGSAALCGGLQSDLLRFLPGVRILPGWDKILVDGEIDAVLVCGVDDEILDAAKQVASAGKSLVIFPRGAQGSTWIYELGLIRDEGRVELAPVFVDRLRATLRAIDELIAAGSLGRLLYLRIDREIAQRDSGGNAILLAREQIEDALLGDVDLFRQLGGDYSRVSAIHSGVVGDRVAAAGLTLLGDKLPEATWTTRGTAGPSQFKLTVAGENGEIIATATGDPAKWLVRTERLSHSNVADLPLAEPRTDDVGSLMLESLPHASQPSSGALRGAQNSMGRAEWMDLVRAFEVIDAAHVSVQRRRPIDLHFETTSERNIFKSQMTAVGCLVLTLTLIGVVFLLVVMPLFDVRGRAQLEAERAGSIVRPAEFLPQSAELTQEGAHHVHEIAARLAGSHFPVLIEQNASPADRKLDERRRDSVVAELKKTGTADAAERTQTGLVVGEWYPQLLRVVRILVFAPLALFLALQLFILLARPGAK